MPRKFATGGLSKRNLLLIVAIFLIAAFLRIYGLNNLSPPGLEHDEVAHWLINRDIQEGNLALYYTEAYGHEAGFHYIQTIFMTLLGDNALSLRLPSVFAGLLLLAISFAFTRKLFGTKVALLSLGILTGLFWPVFYSRLALRAISLPLLSCFSAYFWWKAWHLDHGIAIPLSGATKRSLNSRSDFSIKDRFFGNNFVWFVFSGLFAGLTFYTYMASRMIPIFFFVFILYLAIFHRKAFLSRWRGVLLFVITYIIISAPLALFLLSNPGIESRIAEIDAPLISLAGGNIKPVLENGLKVLAMFGFRGDPLWRQNVANLPVFDPIIALFFYTGLTISVWRWREPRYLFLVLWLFTSSIPSIVTIDAPSSIRIINALPVVTIFPPIGLRVIHFFQRLSTVSTKLSPEIVRKSAVVLLMLVLGLNFARTVRAVYHTWPEDPEVQFVWQEALTDSAVFLDTLPHITAAAIGGWTPESMDPPTMELSLIRKDLSLRFFYPTDSLIIPGELSDVSPKSGIAVIYPTALPPHPTIRNLLLNWSGNPKVENRFTFFELNHPVQVQPNSLVSGSFANEITLIGYDLLTGKSDDKEGSEDGVLDLFTYWRVNNPTDQPRRFFLHLVDKEGKLISQDDRLGAPAKYWRQGDLIVQQLSLTHLTTNAEWELRLGVYNPDNDDRLLTDNRAEYIELQGGLSTR